MELIFKLLGVVGLLFITIGVLTKNRIRQNIFFIIGGLLLETYSIYIRDPIFTPLQAIFVLAAGYDLYRLKKKK